MKTAPQKLHCLQSRYGFSDEEVASFAGLYEGNPFDTESPAFKRLQKLSASLCDEYSALYHSVPLKAGILRLGLNYLRCHRLLKQIFFDCPLSADIRPGFRCLIGQVDLMGTCYMGLGVTFSPTSLVKVENRSVISPKAFIGGPGFGLVHLGEDSWVGAEVRVPTPFDLGQTSVVAAGATLGGFSMPSFSIAYGRPAKIQKLSGSSEPKQPLKPFSAEERKALIEHLKRIGFAAATKDYERIVEGGVVNVGSPHLGRLFLYSHALSAEYSRPETSKERKEEILRLLFPLAGKNLQAGSSLYVDLLGLVKLGENVTLGDDVSFYGRVTIGDDVTIEDGASFYATGHPLDPKEREFLFSLLGARSLTTFASIATGDHLSIGAGAIAVPFASIEQSIPSGAIALSSGHIIA